MCYFINFAELLNIVYLRLVYSIKIEIFQAGLQYLRLYISDWST